MVLYRFIHAVNSHHIVKSQYPKHLTTVLKVNIMSIHYVCNCTIWTILIIKLWDKDLCCPLFLINILMQFGKGSSRNLNQSERKTWIFIYMVMGCLKKIIQKMNWKYHNKAMVMTLEGNNPVQIKIVIEKQILVQVFNF